MSNINQMCDNRLSKLVIPDLDRGIKSISVLIL